MHASDIELFHRRDQGWRVLGSLPIDNRDRSTGYQGQEHFRDANIKRQCCCRKNAILASKSGPFDHAPQHVDGAAVRNHHPFGFSGRAGSVDHVSNIRLWVDWTGCCFRGFFGIGDFVPVAIDDRSRNIELLSQAILSRVCHDVFDFRVFDHVDKSIDGILRVERNIASSGLHDSDQQGRRVGVAITAQTDQISAPDAL